MGKSKGDFRWISHNLEQKQPCVLGGGEALRILELKYLWRDVIEQTTKTPRESNVHALRAKGHWVRISRFVVWKQGDQPTGALTSDTWRVTQQGTAPGIRTGLVSHTRTFVQGKGIPAQPWHHVLWLLLMKTPAKWTFRDFSEHGGYPGRACYFIVSLLWELIWFPSRAFTLLKFTVTTE